MPIYIYQCEDCESTQEELHPMSGANYKITCNECNSKKMKKVPTTPGMFLFAHKVPKSQDPNQRI